MESTKNFKNIKDYLDHWDLFFEEWVKDKEGCFENDPIWSSENRRGKGDKKLDFQVLPQPYLGDIKNHSVITLNLNPSRYSKSKEYKKFEKEIKPIFDKAKDYYTYAKEFPTYDIKFWQNQAKWIDRIFQNLDNQLDMNDSEKIRPFAIEICPWGSKAFQKLDIDDMSEIVEYMDKHVFDIIKKANEYSKLKIVLSVGKAYYDIFKKSEFQKLEEISSKPFEKEFKFSSDNDNTYLKCLSQSENKKFIDEKISKIPYNWPIKFVKRSFSIWEKDGILYFNTYASGSNSPPGDHFDEIQNDLIKRHLQKN